MFNLIDVVVILIILLSAFIGYKRGFVKTIISLFSFFIAIGVAVMFYKPLAVILTENTTIDDWVRDRIVNSRVNESGEIVYAGDTEDSSTSGETTQITYVPETEEEKQITVKEILEDLPNTLTSAFDISEAKENAKHMLADRLSEQIMKLLSLIIIFALVRVTLIVAGFLLNGIMKLPVFKQVNEILGMSFGAVLGFILIYASFAIITFISTVSDISFVIGAIKASSFASAIFENNLIIKLLS